MPISAPVATCVMSSSSFEDFQGIFNTKRFVQMYEGGGIFFSHWSNKERYVYISISFATLDSSFVMLKVFDVSV